MNVLSLFNGIGVAFYALEKAGIKVEKRYASEIDPDCIKVNQNHFPDTIQLGNIQNIDYSKLEKIDLLIGGSPCQDLSSANTKGEGLEGKRSGLFFEYVKALKLLKPRYFIFENVASMKKEDRDIISKCLGVYPVVINAALVSAQQRKRLFWTNIEIVFLPQDKNIKLKDILLNHTYTEKEKSSCLLATYYKSCKNDLFSTTNNKTHVFTKPIRLGHIGKGCQSQRVYNIDGKSICLNANGGGQGAKTGLYEINGYVRKLDPVECERLQCLPDNWTAGFSNSKRYKMLGNAFNAEVIVHILNGMSKHTSVCNDTIVVVDKNKEI